MRGLLCGEQKRPHNDPGCRLVDSDKDHDADRAARNGAEAHEEDRSAIAARDWPPYERNARQQIDKK